MRPATGEQWVLRHGDDELTVVQYGGGLRSWTRAGAPVLAGYEVHEGCRSSRGQVLFPWPNRLRDGHWVDGDVEQQLPLSEPDKHNAIHGLVRFVDWWAETQDSSSVTVATVVRPQPGWPWELGLRVTYRLAEGGLVVESEVTNPGGETARFGLGFHPYVAFTGALADVELQVPFSERLLVDDRLLPVGRESVEATAYDFRTARQVGDTLLDTAYSGAQRDADGRWRVRLAAGVAGPVTVWADESFGSLQMFTGKAGADQPVPGIAVEPMTCPPDALNSGEGLVALEPGETWRGTWGIDL